MEARLIWIERIFNERFLKNLSFKKLEIISDGMYIECV